MLRNAQLEASTLLIAGQVPCSKLTIALGRLLDDTAQDNLICNPYPAHLSLATSQLTADGALTSTTESLFNPVDTLKRFMDSSGFNLAPDKTYLHFSGTGVATGWYDNDALGSGLQDDLALEPGEPLLVRKRAGPATDLTWSPPLPYQP